MPLKIKFTKPMFFSALAATGVGGTGVGDRAAAGSVCPHPAGRCDRTVRDCTTGCTAVVGYHGSGKGVGRERGLVSDKVGEINEIK